LIAGAGVAAGTVDTPPARALPVRHTHHDRSDSNLALRRNRPARAQVPP
jgi:hypothetical protein